MDKILYPTEVFVLVRTDMESHRKSSRRCLGSSSSPKCSTEMGYYIVLTTPQLCAHQTHPNGSLDLRIGFCFRLQKELVAGSLWILQRFEATALVSADLARYLLRNCGRHHRCTRYHTNAHVSQHSHLTGEGHLYLLCLLDTYLRVIKHTYYVGFRQLIMSILCVCAVPSSTKMRNLGLSQS
jgi:hypothetical protein